MGEYSKADARDWARENLRGVADVIIPSFSNDLKGINEAAIRHDVELNIRNGFVGALLVSEVVMSMDEYEAFFSIANDQAKDRQLLIYHAAFSTLDENIRGAQIAKANGACLILLTYPPSFYAESDDDIYAHTKKFCDATSLGVMLFPISTWGFERVHPSDIRAPLLKRLLDDCPNIVAIKAEGGHPTIMGFIECNRLFGDEVVVSCPLEGDMIPLAQLVPIQFCATSNTEYYGPIIPRIFSLLRDRDFEEATKLYWQIHPARRANASAAATWAGTGLISRMQWKYQAWLSGYNGGPLRQPTMRVNDSMMGALRQGLVRSGLDVTPLHDREFFVGRNPM